MGDSRPFSEVLRGWLALAASLLALVAFLVLAELASPKLSGPAGMVYEQNRSRDLDASALFYTEVTDVREFLDVDRGRYGIDRRPRLKFVQENEPAAETDRRR
jgi:hypothetical protein